MSTNRVQVRSDEYTSKWHRVPSWAISLVLHGILLFIFMNTMRGCGGDMSGEAGEEFRNFGIYVKQSNQDEPQDTQPVETTTNNSQADQTNDQIAVDERPPADIDLPDIEIPAIGAGAPMLPANVGSSDIKPPETAPGGQLKDSLGLGPGETAFVDIRDSGKTFVYAIDCSGSMVGNRIAFARAQLASSLNVLQPYQQFQILFYNTSVTQLSLRRNGISRGLYTASQQNVAQAIKTIRSFQPMQGTKHIPALEKAIKLRPDVIFFLTDGHDSPPSPDDLKFLRRLNGGRSRIHCIEFGQGEELATSRTWLRAAAQQNGGRYKYVDVNRLR